MYGVARSELSVVEFLLPSQISHEKAAYASAMRSTPYPLLLNYSGAMDMRQIHQ